MLNSAKAWEYVTFGQITATAICSGGEYVIAGSSDGNVYAFARDGELLWSQTLGAPVGRIAYSLNGNYLAAATATHGETLINFYGINGALLWSRKVSKPARGLSISDDGGIVVIGSDNRNIYTVNYEGNLIFNHRLGGEIPTVAATRDSRFIYAGCYDAFVYCFDLQGRGLWNYKTTGPVEKILVTRSGDLIFAVSADKRLYSLSKTGSMLSNQRFEEVPTTLAIDETARLIALAQGTDLFLMHKETVFKRTRLEGRILEIVVAENGEHFACTTTSNVLHYFDRNGEELWKEEFQSRLTSLAVSEKGHYVAPGTSDKRVYLLDNRNYYRRTLDGVRRAVDEAKQGGMVVLEAEILAQKAEQELEAEAFSSALKYAEAAIKIVGRQRERAKPQISVLGVISEAFRVSKPNTVRTIVMNTGMGHAKNISFRVEGDARIDMAPAREYLAVGTWYEDNWSVIPLKKGETAARFRCMWHDAGDAVQTAEVAIPINAVESEKPLPYKKSAPFIQLGNVQKLIAKVQADKQAGRVPAPPSSMGAPPALDAVVREVQASKCTRCGNLLQEDWKACPKCGAPVGA